MSGYKLNRYYLFLFIIKEKEFDMETNMEEIERTIILLSGYVEKEIDRDVELTFKKHIEGKPIDSAGSYIHEKYNFYKFARKELNRIEDQLSNYNIDVIIERLSVLTDFIRINNKVKYIKPVAQNHKKSETSSKIHTTQKKKTDNSRLLQP